MANSLPMLSELSTAMFCNHTLELGSMRCYADNILWPTWRTVLGRKTEDSLSDKSWEVLMYLKAYYITKCSTKKCSSLTANRNTGFMQ